MMLKQLTEGNLGKFKMPLCCILLRWKAQNRVRVNINTKQKKRYETKLLEIMKYGRFDDRYEIPSCAPDTVQVPLSEPPLSPPRQD